MATGAGLQKGDAARKTVPALRKGGAVKKPPAAKKR